MGPQGVRVVTARTYRQTERVAQVDGSIGGDQTRARVRHWEEEIAQVAESVAGL